MKQGVRQLCIPGSLGIQARMLWSGLCAPLPSKSDSGQQPGYVAAHWSSGPGRGKERAEFRCKVDNIQREV